ncbi:MAG: ECF transporter S component [Spirochaetales bacterium]|uniref:ECF transporter S component n=1 Tax=Candidatus Thalassospirochaeta sargassi TaxID=3119039 RepID=A0AAJ1IAC8_9SPIO|nr:ECF transporter S component [Spirochaetales bacterium]
MNSNEDKKNVSGRIAAIAVMTAVTMVFTYVVRIPIAPTRGYINLGDVAVFFTAFTFGPFTALISGGLGPAIADIVAGYSQWAPITFAAHGLQGLAAALVIKSLGNRKVAEAAAGLAGMIVMAGLYLAGGAFMVGFAAAVVEVPMNIIQNAVGVFGGFVLSRAVKKAYPPVSRLAW